MNIRAKIFGGVTTEESIVRSKKSRRGINVDSLHGLIRREDARTSHNRFEDRHRLLDECVKLRHGSATHEVNLINVSGGGAMVGGDLELALWDKVELELGENGTIECAVRWVRDGRFGLEFAHETRIDCGADQQAAVLRDVIHRSFPDLKFEAEVEFEPEPEHSGPEAREDKRHPLVWSGILHHDYESTPVRLRNVSETGALIDCPATLTAGSEPLLELGGEVTISCKVAWIIGDQAGLQFDRPFDLHDLARARPEVTAAQWNPPSYLDGGAESSSDDHWGRVSIGELRQQLEGFMKR